MSQSLLLFLGILFFVLLLSPSLTAWLRRHGNRQAIGLVNLGLIVVFLLRTLVHHTYYPLWASHWISDALLFLGWAGTTLWAWRGSTEG